MAGSNKLQQPWWRAKQEPELLHSHIGEWLREAGEYKQLFSSPNIGLLWIQGIPGSGKRVIAARLVYELSQSGVPVCYFSSGKLSSAIVLKDPWLSIGFPN